MKAFKGFLVLFMLLMISPAVSAEIGIVIDGKALSTEIKPFIEDDSTYISVHSVGDMLGTKDVLWNEEERSVTITFEGSALKLFIDFDTAYMNSEPILTNAPAIIRYDRAYLPVRFVSETLGADVGWDGNTKTVYITFEKDEDNSDLLWLARIVHVEAGRESYEGRLAVANVILNRVKNPKFPNTIYDVIFQKNQFPPAGKGMLDNLTPNEGSIEAAKAALSGINNVGESLYFCAASQTATSWVANNRTFCCRIGNHCFYY